MSGQKQRTSEGSLISRHKNIKESEMKQVECDHDDDAELQLSNGMDIITESDCLTMTLVASRP